MSHDHFLDLFFFFSSSFFSSSSFFPSPSSPLSALWLALISCHVFARVPRTNYAWQGIIRLIKTTNRISHRPLFCADQLGADVLRPRPGPARSKRCLVWCCTRNRPLLRFWGGREVCSVDSTAEAECPQCASAGAAVITVEPRGVPDAMLSTLPPHHHPPASLIHFYVA